MSWCDGILLECAGVVVAAYLAGDAGGIYTGEAGGTIAASRGHPFDADAVAGFELGGLGAGAKRSDCADAFMATDLAGLGGMAKNTTPLEGKDV